MRFFRKRPRIIRRPKINIGLPTSKTGWVGTLFILYSIGRGLFWVVERLGDIEFLAEHKDDIMDVVGAPWFASVVAIAGLFLIYLNSVMVSRYSTTATPVSTESIGINAPVLPTSAPNPERQPKIVLDEQFKATHTIPYPRNTLEVAFVAFSNQPQVRHWNSNVTVVASLRYYKRDRKTQLISRPITGIWCGSPPREQLEVAYPSELPQYDDMGDKCTLDYKGRPGLLYLAVRHKKDANIYAVDPRHFAKRAPEYELTEDEIHVQIHLTGENVDESYWIVLSNTEENFGFHTF